MKKKICFFLLFVLATVLLSACNNKQDMSDEAPEIIEVDLEVPEKGDANQPILLKATVTQGKEKVKDADEVKFEIWEEGKKEDSQMINAKNNNDGTYTLEFTFSHDGVYTVQVHVTARGMHSMPKKSITIGSGAKTEESQQNHRESDEHEDHTHGLHMHFMKEKNIMTKKATTFTVHLEKEGKPLEKAEVHYEVWNNENNEQPVFVGAKEVQKGEYKADYTFDKKGTYTVKIHVKNEEGLHAHEEHTVEVKN